MNVWSFINIRVLKPIEIGCRNVQIFTNLSKKIKILKNIIESGLKKVLRYGGKILKIPRSQKLLFSNLFKRGM